MLSAPYSCPILVKLVICWTVFRKSTQVPNFMKIHPVGSELFHEDKWTDGQTDITKLILAYQNFANAHKNKNLYNQKNSRKRHVDVLEEG
jgi:hypothetical protein